MTFKFENKDLSYKEKKKLAQIFVEIERLINDVCDIQIERGGHHWKRPILSDEEAKELQAKMKEKEQKIDVLQDKLIMVFEKYPELLRMTKKEDRRTSDFLKILTNKKLCRTLKHLLQKDETLCYKENELGYNIISLLAMSWHGELCDLLLELVNENKNLLKHQDSSGRTLAMHCDFVVSGKLDDIVKMSLQDDEIALLQDKSGNNLGMVCAWKKRQDLFDLAYQNEKLRKQTDHFGFSMYDKARMQGLKLPELTKDEQREIIDKNMSKRIDYILEK